MPVSSTRHPESPSAAADLQAEVDRQLDQALFEALANGTRLRVLSCLIKCGRECSVSEVAECCDVDFSVVNKHLKVLAGVGVLETRKDGRTVWYAARCGDLCERLRRLINAIAEWCPNLPSADGTTGRSGRGDGVTCCRFVEKG